MGSSQADIYQTVRQAVCKDVVFDHISPKLLETKLISCDDFQKIKACVTDHEQMSLLLDILFKKGTPAFESFATLLKTDYPWISELLEDKIKPIDSNKTPNISKLATGITQEMIKMVQKNYRVADKWTVLAHSLGLSRLIMDIRIRVNMYGEQNSMCVLYLLQEWMGICPGDATLGRLIQVLRDQDFNDIADELAEKFA